MAIVLVMITLIHSFIFGSGYTADASETVSTAAGSGELHSETAEGNAVITGSVTFTDESKLVEVQQIYLPFPDVTGQKTEWDFPYSDEFFSLPSDEFCITMARGSMGLTLSAFRSNTESMSSQYETYLKEAGFTDIYSFGYDKLPTEDSLSGVIGMKRIGDTTVIAAAACGQGYGNEWASNFKVGDGERFDQQSLYKRKRTRRMNFLWVLFRLFTVALSMHRAACAAASAGTAGAAADMPACLPVKDQPAYDQSNNDQKDRCNDDGSYICLYPEQHISQLLSFYVFQAIAKVCASWKLYEHSNGFRAKNF